MKTAPILLYRALKDRNLDLFTLALDLVVPPISLFGIILLLGVSFAPLEPHLLACHWYPLSLLLFV